MDCTQALVMPVDGSTSISWTKASRSGILYAMPGIFEATFKDEGRGMESMPVKLYIGKGQRAP